MYVRTVYVQCTYSTTRTCLLLVLAEVRQVIGSERPRSKPASLSDSLSLSLSLAGRTGGSSLFAFSSQFLSQRNVRRSAKHGESRHRCRPQLRLYVQDAHRRQLWRGKDGLSGALLRRRLLPVVRVDGRHRFQGEDAFQVSMDLFRTARG